MNSLRRAAAAAALVLAVTGCSVRVGTPDSTASWYQETDTTLGAAVSGLGTAGLVLKNQDAGRLTRSYVVVAMRDTVEALNKETATYLAVQPPASVAEQHRRAVAALTESLAVLTTASTAASGSDRAARVRALGQVRRTGHEVQDLQDQLARSAP